MSRKLVLCAVAVALLAFSVATRAKAASAVYFPVESLTGISETWLHVTNNGDGIQSVTTRFIPIFQDGTKAGAEKKTFHVASERTRVVKDAVPPGQVGLLEVVAPADVSVAAWLSETGAPDQGVPVEGLPIISSRTVADGGSVLDLVGFRRLDTGEVVSDVRLVNLSSEPNSCQAQIFRGNGTNPWGTVLLGAAPALTVLPFDDFLLALGELNSDNIRVRFECEGAFYAYGAVRDPERGTVSFIQPSVPVALEGLAIPGDEGGGGGGGGSNSNACVNADICFERKGTFHTARSGDGHEALQLPIPPGQYSKLHLNVDILNAGPPNVRGGGYVEQLVFWLAVTNHYNLYGFVRLRNAGPGFELSNTHGVGVPYAGKTKQATGMSWPFGQTYNFDYVYDAGNRSVALTVRNAQGNVVASLQAPTNVSRVTMPSAAHEVFHLVFGYNEGRENKNEYVSYGWKYSNLAVGAYR